ncbi:MAG: tetratricopeptide repeat protein, partial [Candidatus Brocadiales bacterium]|nr:tetratricopeptide repeat protein [Candidatus Brocadiales bacterium]
MVKSLLCVLTIALVVQGLFFSVDGAEDLKVKTSFAVEEKLRFEQARIYAERGLVDLAIPELQKTIELYPNDIETHAYLGWAYSQKGLISDAVQELKKVLEMNPDLQKSPFDYPMSKVIPSSVHEFTKSFEGMIDLVNGFSGAHEILGLCYVMQGRLGNALNEYKKVLDLESYFVRKGFAADCKKTISMIDQAIREYEDDLRERPDYVEAYLKLACAYAEKGALDAAVENMKKVISLEPDRLEARVYLGCFYAKKWMLDEAIKELEEAKQLRGRIVEKLITEAERFIHDCMFDKAISVTREVMNVDSGNKKARWLLAMAYGKKGEMDEAVDICKEVIGLYPDDVQTYVLLGWIYAQHDLLADAMNLAERAIRIESENTDVRALMAYIYASQNQVREAIETFNIINNKTAEKNNIGTDYGWVR